MPPKAHSPIEKVIFEWNLVIFQGRDSESTMPGIRDTLHEKIGERLDENQLLSRFHYQSRRMAKAYPGSVSLKHTEIWEKLKTHVKKPAK